MARISNSKFRSIPGGSGNLDSVAAGTVTAGGAVANAQVRPGTLGATFVVDAETDTLTIEAAWQVSDDSSTWVDAGFSANNPAAVVLATGTAGADAPVTKWLPAPAGVAGSRFVRAAVINKVATGAATDTYAITYKYIAS